jgi:Flp pilus assembly protein TadG
MDRMRGGNAWWKRGTTMVEMAILLPLLLMLTLGAIEYGWLFSTIQRVTNAARQGARVQAVLDAPATAGRDMIQSLLSGGWIKSITVTTDEATRQVTATVSIYVQGGSGHTGAALLNCPSLVPIPAEWQVVIKMAKEYSS